MVKQHKNISSCAKNWVGKKKAVVQVISDSITIKQNRLEQQCKN
jgi:hypothetical protein